MRFSHLLAGALVYGSLLLSAADVPPVTTIGGEAGDLLKKWFAEGTAAGNVGDIYDNRDREHSGLNMKMFPQLGKHEYSKEELDKRMDWAFFGGVRKGIVFGNSSTSAGAYQGGSNPRQAYANPKGLEVLYRQYVSNNVYMYPEHRDHDPGHNGSNDGYGDLYPTNTPFVIISQGSSGSDQPFMRAVPLMLASLRPDVKKKLAETGQLMSVVQMILRYTQKHLADPAKDYLTGKAHPTVFEGSSVQDAVIAKMAHEITVETLPPQVKIDIVKEDQLKDGLDFFEPGATEGHATLPVLIARIFRGHQQTRTMTVSAEGSGDPNNKPLKYHWVVLRGDASRIKITPKNESGSIVEIQVGYHERRPISAGSNMESTRVDIGAFVHNGTYFSAPAFVTYMFLDNEARTYRDDGKVLEIGYKTGDTQLSIQDWPKFFALMEGEAKTWPVKLLREELKEAVAALAAAGKEYEPLMKAASEGEGANRTAQEAVNKANATLKDAEKKEQDAKTAAAATPDDAQKAALKEAEAARVAAADERKKLEDTRREVEKKRNAAKEATEKFLRDKREGLPQPIQATVEAAFLRVLKDPDFMVAQHSALSAYQLTPEGKGTAGAYKSALGKLPALGIAEPIKNDEAPKVLWLRGEKAKATAFERAMLERCNAELLGALYPGIVRAEFKVNYVQPEIAEAPAWRDVYRYAPNGTLLGWMRYGVGEPSDFNAEGLQVLTKDDKGRPLSARTVVYESEKIEREEMRKKGWPYWRKTNQAPGNETRFYKYESDQDFVGKVERTEKAEEKKPDEKKPEEKKDEKSEK